MPEVSIPRRKARDVAEAEAKVDAPGATSGEPASLDDLDIVPSPNPGPDGARSSAEPVLDGGFVRSGRPVSVLPPDPGPMPGHGEDLSLHDLATDVEPVSLRDLGKVLGPPTIPPAWAGAPGGGLKEVASGLKPRLPRSRKETLSEAKAEPAAPSKQKTVPRKLVREGGDGEEKPSFFRVDSIPPPADDIPVEVTESVPPPSSGRADLMALIAPNEAPRARTSDLFNLNSGLFNNVPQPRIEPLLSIDGAPASVPLAPVLPPERVPISSRPPPPAGDRVADAAAPSITRRAPKSGAPGPMVAERQPSSRRSGLVGWAVGAVAAAAVIGFVAAHFEPATAKQQEAREEAASTATMPPSAPQSIDRPARVAVEPTSESAPARTAEAANKPAVAPSVSARAADAPRAGDSRPKDRATAPATAAVAVTPPPAAAPPPPPAPAGGGEFDRAAAKAALASAASAAAGCKQPDEAGGGARVSVTFAPSGRVTASKLAGGSFAGTPTGSCIARAFRSITIPPFSGDPVTITKEVSVR
ncbi:MAG: hypothetical protein QM820_64215 [Minicystis sp.]